MQKAYWYSFYSRIPESGDLLQSMAEQINLGSIKLHPIGAEIAETENSEKLHQLGAEMPFPAVFGLPTAQGKLAQQIIKDTYDLSFVSLPQGYDENALEDALEKNITQFLLELGTGFAFVGRQKEIVVSGKTRKIDMLFYHIHLRCYVVIELKAASFEPEFAGKLNFYVNAVNELIRTPNDNPTIGLLICKDKDQTEVQWAFQGIQTPMGVASYDNIRLQEIQAQLPTTEQIQQRIERAEEEYRLIIQAQTQ